MPFRHRQTQTPQTPALSKNRWELAQGMILWEKRGAKCRTHHCRALGLRAGLIPTQPRPHRSHPHRRQAGTAPSASSSKRGRFSLHVSTATACQCQEGQAESILENEKPRLSKRVRRAVEASPGKAGRRARVRMGESTARSPIAASSKHTAWKIIPARGIS